MHIDLEYYKENLDIKKFTKDVNVNIAKSISNLEQRLNNIKAGRINSDMIQDIKINYYGQMTSLSDLAGISSVNLSTLIIKPWEKDMIPEIEQVIRNANLGFSVESSNQGIYIKTPPLSEETRKKYIKLAHQEAENAKIAIRNIRRDITHHIDTVLKDSSEDIIKELKNQLDIITNDNIKIVNQILAKKEESLISI